MRIGREEARNRNGTPADFLAHPHNVRIGVVRVLPSGKLTPGQRVHEQSDRRAARCAHPAVNDQADAFRGAVQVRDKLHDLARLKRGEEPRRIGRCYVLRFEVEEVQPQTSRELREPARRLVVRVADGNRRHIWGHLHCLELRERNEVNRGEHDSAQPNQAGLNGVEVFLQERD